MDGRVICFQAEMTVKVCAMQEEIRKAEIELNVAENEYASLASFLVGEQYEWPKEIEIITAEGKQLEEALIAERKASADFRSKGMEIDMEVTFFKYSLFSKMRTLTLYRNSCVRTNRIFQESLLGQSELCSSF